MAPFQITIQKHFKPFSKKPGTRTLIPGSSLSIEAFPTKLRFFNQACMSPELIAEIDFKFTAVMDSFVLMLDLEKEVVEVSGFFGLYPFRLKIRASSTSLQLHFQKTLPLSFVFKPFTQCKISKTEGMIQEKDVLQLELNGRATVSPRKNLEKFSLGCHQKQDMDQLSQKQQLSSILPLWLKLASSYQWLEAPPLNYSWTPLFSELRDLLSKKEHDKILLHVKRLFKAGFFGVLCPRLQDTDFQGIVESTCSLEKMDERTSSLIFLKDTAPLLRSLFIQCDKESIELLPHLPPEFFSGRFINVSTYLGSCDFEWTKKMLRRVIFRASKEGVLRLTTPSSLQSFRLRSHKNEKGIRISCGESFKVKSGLDYFLDQFQK